MNLLTDKAKIDFMNWCKNKVDASSYNPKVFSLDLAKVIYNNIVIEWLDSVGILVSTHSDMYCKFHSYINIDKTYKRYQISEGVLTRNEATEAAIFKANEIYNQK